MKELEPQALTVSRGWNSERKVSVVMIPSEGCEEESILCTSLSLWWTWGTHCYSSVFRLRSPIPSPTHSILLCSPTQFHSFSLQSLLYLFIYLFNLGNKCVAAHVLRPEVNLWEPILLHHVDPRDGTRLSGLAAGIAALCVILPV